MQSIHFKYNSYQLQAIVTPSGKLEFLVPSLIASFGNNSSKLGRKLMNGIVKEYKQRKLILSTTSNKPFRQLTIEKDVLLEYCRHNVHIKEFASLANFLANATVPLIDNDQDQDSLALPGSSIALQLESTISKTENGWYYFLDSLKAIDFKLKVNAVEFRKQLWDAISPKNKTCAGQPKEYQQFLINCDGLDNLANILESYKELVYSNELPQTCSWGLLNGQIYYTAKSTVIILAKYFQQEVNEKYVSKYLDLVSEGNKTKQSISIMGDTPYYGWLLAGSGVKELAIHFAALQQSLALENQLNTITVNVTANYDDFTKIPVEVVFELIDNLEGHPIDFDAAWKWAGYSRKDNAKKVLQARFDKDSDFSVTLRKSSGGRQAEKIHLTIDCFKHFCIMANTKKGGKCRHYLLNCEKELRQKRSISITGTTNYTVHQFINKKIPILALTPALNNQEFYSRYAYAVIAQCLTGRKNSFEELWQELVIDSPNLKNAVAWDAKVIKESIRWGFRSQDMETMYRNTLTATALKKCVKQGTISIENAQNIEVLLKDMLQVIKPLTTAPKRPRLIQPSISVNTTPGDKAKELESSEVVELIARKCVSLESRGDTWYRWIDLIQTVNQDVDRMDSELETHIWNKLEKSYKRKYRGSKFITKKGIAQTIIVYSGFVYPDSKIKALPEVAKIFFNNQEILEAINNKKAYQLSQAIHQIDTDGIAANTYISDWVSIDETNKFYVESTAFGDKYQEVYINKLGFVQLIQSYLKRKEKVNSSNSQSLEREFALLDVW
ncbi:MAG: hypothetical protein AAF378_00115 [Cyanobacteria bacterium P01_A01_bin.84]